MPSTNASCRASSTEPASSSTTPSQVGGYPSLPSTAPAPDDDGDGMPNSAEVANGTNPSAPDSNGDVNGNGYTNIEDWFNGLAPSPPRAGLSATALTLKGDKAIATVTANGAAPNRHGHLLGRWQVRDEGRSCRARRRPSCRACHPGTTPSPPSSSPPSRAS